MAEEDREDEEEEWETEEHIVGVSNIDFNDRPIYSFPIERNDFPEEQKEIEEVGEEILYDDFIEQDEGIDYTLEDLHAGKSNFEESNTSQREIPLGDNLFPDAENNNLIIEEHIVGESNLTEDDLIPEQEEIIEYEIIKEEEEEELSEELKNVDTKENLKGGSSSMVVQKANEIFNEEYFKSVLYAWDSFILIIKEVCKNKEIFAQDSSGKTILHKIGVYFFGSNNFFYNVRSRHINYKTDSFKNRGLITLDMLEQIIYILRENRDFFTVDEFSLIEDGYNNLYIIWNKGRQINQFSPIEKKNRKIIKIWDSLISSLDKIFQEDVYPKLGILLTKENILQLSLLICREENYIHQLRRNHISYKSINYIGFMPLEKLQNFYSFIEKFQDKISLDSWQEIYAKFSNLYKILYGSDKAPSIVKKPETFSQRMDRLKSEFQDYMWNLLENLYPDNLEMIPSKLDLQSKFNISITSVDNWFSDLLEKRYKELGLNKSEIASLNYQIWSWRDASLEENQVSYEQIEKFVELKGGNLETTKEQFENMDGPNSKKYIVISHLTDNCEFHQWPVKVGNLIYVGSWCPRCNVSRSEKAMRLFMEAIFKGLFPETTLNEAFGIPFTEGGSQSYDGHNSSVYIQNRLFKIVNEYDGIHHDKISPPFTNNQKELDSQKKNDSFKTNEAFKNNAILIRLKAVNGFSFKNANEKFEKEIIRQFFNFTGIKIPFKGYKFDV